MNVQVAIPSDITVSNLAEVFSVFREDAGIGGQFKVLQSPAAGPWKVDIVDFGEWKSMSLTPNPDGRSLTVSFQAWRPQVSWIFGNDIFKRISELFIAAVGIVAMIGSAIQGQFATSGLFAVFVAVMIGVYFWDKKENTNENNEDVTKITDTIFDLSRKLHAQDAATATEVNNSAINTQSSTGNVQ